MSCLICDCGGKQLPCSPPYVVPQEVGDQIVTEIAVYDIPSSNPGLKVIGAKHCFMMLKTNKNKSFVLEAGKNKEGKVGITYA